MMVSGSGSFSSSFFSGSAGSGSGSFSSSSFSGSAGSGSGSSSSFSGSAGSGSGSSSFSSGSAGSGSGSSSFSSGSAGSGSRSSSSFSGSAGEESFFSLPSSAGVMSFLAAQAAREKSISTARSSARTACVFFISFFRRPWAFGILLTDGFCSGPGPPDRSSIIVRRKGFGNRQNRRPATRGAGLF